MLAGAAVAECPEDGSADDDTDEADDHVHVAAEAGTLDDETREPACVGIRLR